MVNGNENYRYEDCEYYPGNSRDSNGQVTKNGPAFRYETLNVLNAFCIPNGEDYMDAETYEAFKDAFFNSVYGEKAGVWAYNIM